MAGQPYDMTRDQSPAALCPLHAMLIYKRQTEAPSPARSIATMASSSSSSSPRAQPTLVLHLAPPMLLLLLLISFPRTGTGAPETAPLSVLCNSATYGAGDPFAESLAYVLSDLLGAAPSRAGRDVYSISPYPNAFAYGHAACRAGGAALDCAGCLGSAVAQMNDTCGHAVGARAVLVGCRLRYEQYAFVD